MRSSKPAEPTIHVELRDPDQLVQRVFGVGYIAPARQPPRLRAPEIRINGLRIDAEAAEIEQRPAHLVRRRDENARVVIL